LLEQTQLLSDATPQTQQRGHLCAPVSDAVARAMFSAPPAVLAVWGALCQFEDTVGLPFRQILTGLRKNRPLGALLDTLSLKPPSDELRLDECERAGHDVR